MRRHLSLRKETLTELATEELGSVVGGVSENGTCVTFSELVTGCQCTALVPTLNVRCPTTEVTSALVGSLPCK